MSIHRIPTGEKTSGGQACSFVVNIIEEVLYPVQVRSSSPELAAQQAEAIYQSADFDPEKECGMVETGHTIYTEHVGTEVVARDGHALDESVRLETKIKLFCADKGIDFEDRPLFSSARAAIALDAFSKLQGDGEEVELVTDLLSDLMHLCQKRGLEFDELLDTARSNYEGERA